MTATALRLPRQKGQTLLSPSRVLAVLVAAGLLALALSGRAGALSHALDRAVSAEPGWLVLGVLAEAVSIAGYVFLFALVTGVGAVTSYRISLAGTAATRLLPTAGLGGVAFTVWALRDHATQAGALVLRFLTVLYAVFLLALAGSAALAAVDGRTWAVFPFAGAVAAMVTAVALARRRQDAPPLLIRGHEIPRLGPEVRAAAALVRAHDPRLVGAIVWWAADAAVLGFAFAAVGAAPALGVLLLVYFLGAVANTVPVPGAMSGGLIGVAVLSGIAPAAAIAGVVIYRAIAMWLPTPFGAQALMRLGVPKATSRRQAAGTS